MRNVLLALLLVVGTGCQVVIDDEQLVNPDGDDLEVPLEIVEGAGAGTLAFVPVTIHGEGPFPFALDTGAAEATPVQIEDWQIGAVDLGARPVLTLDLASADQSVGLHGLLGSDVLSEFGAVMVDYDAGVLTLRPRQASP